MVDNRWCCVLFNLLVLNPSHSFLIYLLFCIFYLIIFVDIIYRVILNNFRKLIAILENYIENVSAADTKGRLKRLIFFLAYVKDRSKKAKNVPQTCERISNLHRKTDLPNF